MKETKEYLAPLAKPCPFCGGRATVHEPPSGPVLVHCKECGCGFQAPTLHESLKRWDGRYDRMIPHHEVDWS